jgi:ABC-type transport system involved in multi-copper enzyme maturation permease subunit
MKMPKAFFPIIKIAKYTLTDEVRQRSFIVMFVICVTFVFLMRGCYHGNYMVNGQELDAGAIVGSVSRATFHVIAVGMMLLTALFSMRVFRRDRDEGMQSSILSKPITRRQYVIGKVLGLWVLSAFFMFILHAIIFLTASITLKVVMPGYLVASLLCSFNLLFVVIVVLLFSLMMPDIAAFLCVMGIGIISFVADGIFAISHSPMAQAMMPQQGSQQDWTAWRVVFYLWPKLSGTQNFASLFIGSEGFPEYGSIYPLINILIYGLIFGALLFWRFSNEDII